MQLGLAGQIRQGEMASAQLGRSWNYWLYVPDEPPQMVLYLFHGHGGSGHDWIEQGDVPALLDRLIAEDRMPPVVAVMPDAGTSWYVNSAKGAMENAIMDDLLPTAEAEVGVHLKRDERAMMGVSMGGYGALRLAMRYPEQFGAAALLAPACYVPVPPEDSGARSAGVFGGASFNPVVWMRHNYPAYWDAFMAKGLPLPMFIGAGDDDHYNTEAQATLLNERLQRAGLPAQLRIVDGGHDWPTWKSMEEEALDYLAQSLDKLDKMVARQQTGLPGQAQLVAHQATYTTAQSRAADLPISGESPNTQENKEP
jgi:enterochelin esterase-like enzyme